MWKLQYFLWCSPNSVRGAITKTWMLSSKVHWEASRTFVATGCNYLVLNVVTTDWLWVFIPCFLFSRSGILQQDCRWNWLLHCIDNLEILIKCSSLCRSPPLAAENNSVSLLLSAPIFFATMGTRWWNSQEYWWLLKHIYKITWDSMSLICYLAEE